MKKVAKKKTAVKKTAAKRSPKSAAKKAPVKKKAATRKTAPAKKVAKKTKPARQEPKGFDPIKPVLARVKAGFNKKIAQQFEDATRRYGLNAAMGKLEKLFKDPDVGQKGFYYRTGLDLDTMADQLVKLADKNGITPRAAAKFADVQKELGLNESEISEHLIRRAEHFEREGNRRIKDRVERINGKRKGTDKKSPAPESPKAKKGTKAPAKKAEGTKGRGARVNGMTNKNIAFAEWNKDKATGKEEAERIHGILDGAVQLGSVRGWISQWSKGKNFPASAKK